jgi:hypothetical protein
MSSDDCQVTGSGENAELILDGDVQDCDHGDKRRCEDEIHNGFLLIAKEGISSA